MNDYLLQKAQQRAYKSAEEINKLKPIAKPRGLSEVKLARLEERELEKIAPETGYPELDKLIKGFIPGHLYTMTGDTNVGKTSVACNFAVKVAFQMKRVLYIALEPENSVIEYIASVFHKKRFDELEDDDLDLGDLPIHVLGKEEIDSADNLIETIETLDRYDLIIVDHIGYFITSEKNWLQQQSNVVKKLIGIAKKKQSAVMLIAHLRKKGKNDRKHYIAGISDISGSAAFGQDSTDVMIVTRNLLTEDKDEVRYSNVGRLSVVKTKSGPNGYIPLEFSERNANIVSPAVASTTWEEPPPL